MCLKAGGWHSTEIPSCCNPAGNIFTTEDIVKYLQKARSILLEVNVVVIDFSAEEWKPEPMKTYFHGDQEPKSLIKLLQIQVLALIF